MLHSNVGLIGSIRWELYGPDKKLKCSGENHNIVTTEGDAWIADQLSVAAKDPMDQMVLGTGTASPDKSDSWVSGTFPNSGAAAGTAGQISVGTTPGTASAIRYVGTFGPGYATQNSISEAIITNVTPGTSGADPGTGDVLCHALLDPVVNKGSLDELIITWDIKFLGA